MNALSGMGGGCGGWLSEAQGQRGFHLPSHWWCCFPVECPLTPLHLTSSSHCDTVTLAVSWHTHASCNFPAVSAECASHFHTPGAQNSAQQQKLTMTEKQTQFMGSSSFFSFSLGIWDYFMFQDLLPIYSWWKNWDEWRISTSINLQCRLAVGCK